MDETLAQFAAQIDDHLGREAGFEQAVRDYRRHTDLAAALSARGELRAEIHARIERLIENKTALIDGQPIRRVRRGGQRRLVLRSEIVKQVNPGLWDASRSNARILSIKLALAGKPRIPRPPMTMTADVWAAYELTKKRCTAAKRAAETARLQLLTILDDVEDTWNGVPKLTSDGWTVGAQWQLRFSADKCKTLAERDEIDLSDMISVETAPLSTTYELVTSAVDEFDEIDGQ